MSQDPDHSGDLQLPGGFHSALHSSRPNSPPSLPPGGDNFVGADDPDDDLNAAWDRASSPQQPTASADLTGQADDEESEEEDSEEESSSEEDSSSGDAEEDDADNNNDDEGNEEVDEDQTISQPLRPASPSDSDEEVQRALLDDAPPPYEQHTPSPPSLVVDRHTHQFVSPPRNLYDQEPTRPSTPASPSRTRSPLPQFNLPAVPYPPALPWSHLPEPDIGETELEYRIRNRCTREEAVAATRYFHWVHTNSEYLDAHPARPRKNKVPTSPETPSPISSPASPSITLDKQLPVPSEVKPPSPTTVLTSPLHLFLLLHQGWGDHCQFRFSKSAGCGGILN